MRVELTCPRESCGKPLVVGNWWDLPGNYYQPPDAGWEPHDDTQCECFSDEEFDDTQEGVEWYWKVFEMVKEAITDHEAEEELAREMEEASRMASEASIDR